MAALWWELKEEIEGMLPAPADGSGSFRDTNFWLCADESYALEGGGLQ